jgi:hypothetical protein
VPPGSGLAADIEPYVIEINFEAIPDPARRNYFPTGIRWTR